jgi:hypothetical protein
LSGVGVASLSPVLLDFGFFAAFEDFIDDDDDFAVVGGEGEDADDADADTAVEDAAVT